MGNKILKTVLGVFILAVVAVIILVVNTIGVKVAMIMVGVLGLGVAIGYLAKTLQGESNKRCYKTRYVIPKKQRIYREEDYT